MFKMARKIVNIDFLDYNPSIVGLPNNISRSKLNEIKSLYQIKIEAAKGENRIVALLNDLWLYSEIPDKNLWHTDKFNIPVQSTPVKPIRIPHGYPVRGTGIIHTYQQSICLPDPAG